MKPLLDLPWRSCKWPVAEQGGKHLFCGVALGGETPETCFYCPEHAARSRASARLNSYAGAVADVFTRHERIRREGPEEEAIRDLVEEIGE